MTRYFQHYFGLGLCITILLIFGYETLGLVTPLPTISRILQGWRDSGHYVAVYSVVVILLTIMSIASAWLFHHLLFEARSPL